MAARDSHRSHPAAPEPAVPLHRLVCVLGTGRVVATRRGKNLRERLLVTADQSEQDRCHCFSWESLRAACRVSLSSSANGTTSAAGRAIRTTSYRIPTPRSGESDPRSCVRAASRSRRRARLRATEPLTFRLTVTPTRLSWLSRGTANATSARPEYTRVPLIAAWKSERRRTRKRCFTGADSLRGQSLAPFATTVLHHSRSAPRGHAAKKAMHPAAVALLWLIGSLDEESPFARSPTEPR